MIQKFHSILLKAKMRQLILCLCTQAVVFTLILGIYSYFSSKNMASNTESIYSYQGYTQTIRQVQTGYLQVKSLYAGYASTKDDETLTALEQYNSQVREQIDYYNSTEYDDEEEELLVQNIESSYIKLYDLYNQCIGSIKNGTTLDSHLAEEIANLEQALDGYFEELNMLLDSWGLEDMQTIRSEFQRSIQFQGIVVAVCVLFFSMFAYVTLRVFNHHADTINASLKRASEGDLTESIIVKKATTEFGQMQTSLQQTLTSFATIINQLKQDSSAIDGQSEDLRANALELSTSINNISESIQQVRSATEEQASDIDGTVQVLNEFSHALLAFSEDIHTLSSNSLEVSNIATSNTSKMDEISVSIEEVNTLVTSFLAKFEVLSNTVAEINSITEFINSISAQTNLLALNASIESARVGEAGKGFAVVATEIGQLADQSKQASNTISNLIQQISAETDVMQQEGTAVKQKLSSSTTAIEESLVSFKPMFALLNDMVEKIRTLNTSSEKIIAGKDHIYDKMEQTAFIANEISASADNIAKPLADITQISVNVSNTSEYLANLTTTLNENIQQFKTKDTAHEEIK